MDIKAIKARAEALDHWRIETGNKPENQAGIDVLKGELVDNDYCKAAAEFWIGAETDIPNLITEVERLQAELDAAKKENEKRKEAMGKLASTLSQSGFCTHYAGYTCDKDWPEACEGCIKQWAMRGPVKGE